MPKSATRIDSFRTTIFSEINNLALQHQAINLGQGKPDFDAPPEVINELVEALRDGKYNQYAPGTGTFSLCLAIANHQARFYGIHLDPASEIVVTAGATEGIFSAVMGLVDPGDEVIVIEPYYDSYLPSIIMAHAVPVFVPLHSPSWTFDPDELRRAFSPRTRALILNTPQNPTGRVFSLRELQLIADLCNEYDVTVISDEVYEHLIFGEAHHQPIALLPEMFERTVTVSSSGKLFNATGWKIGWVSGPPELISGVLSAHQFVTFAVHHPTQRAITYALNLPDSYYQDFQKMYDQKRRFLLSALEQAGLVCSAPEGTYFILADHSAVFKGDSLDFARYLTSEIGVACIPTETFYSSEHRQIGSKVTRFSFCKTDDLLQQATERLQRLR